MNRSRRLAGVVLVGILAAPAAAAAAPRPATIPYADTAGYRHHDQTGAWNDSQRQLLHARTRQQPLRRGVQGRDVGEIAVIPDNGRIFLRPRPDNPFDLVPGTSLRFSPHGSGFAPARTATEPLDVGGAPLTLADDDSREVALPFAFPFLGREYTSIHVNSDGNVTLGQGDTSLDPRDAARLTGGPPRIAPLLQDLNPSAGGEVRVDVNGERAVVTWDQIPTYGVDNANTLQAVLARDGEVTLAFGPVDERYGVTGLAEGGDAGPFHELDLSGELPAALPAGAILEELAPPIPDGRPRVDVIAAAFEFYATHPDHYDFLVLFTESPQALDGGGFAFHLGMQNRTRGLGQEPFDRGYPWRELESILDMNQIGLYWSDEGKLEDPPLKMFRFAPGANSFDGPPGLSGLANSARWFGTAGGRDAGNYVTSPGAFTLGLHSGMSLLAHEVGHRWAAYPRYRDPATGQISDALLDAEGPGIHWSFFHDTHVPAEQFGGGPRASAMEGNVLRDLGAGAWDCAVGGHTPFISDPDELADGYSALDQYLMGLRAASEVPPFLHVDDPRFWDTDRSVLGARSILAEQNARMCGRRVDLTVGDIRAVAGDRVPAHGDEDDMGTGRDVKTMAFVLIVDDDSQKAEAHAAAINHVDAVRRAWERYYPKATGGRGRFDTRLHPPVH